LYTAILTLGMSAFATSNECAWHSRQAAHEARPGKVTQDPGKETPAAKPLITEKEIPLEYSSLVLTLYV
jgi:hypothetical protein